MSVDNEWIDDDEGQGDCPHDDLWIMCALCGAVHVGLPKKPEGIETGTSAQTIRVSWDK